MQLQTTSPDSRFPNEYTDVIFIRIDQHLKSYCQHTKASWFYETRCRMQVWNVLHAAHWKYRTQKWHKKSAPSHNFVGLYLHN